MKILKIFIGFLIFFIFFYIIYKENIFFIFLKKAKSANYLYLFFAFSLYIFVFVLRSLRIKILEKDKDFLSLFSIIGINTFLNNILPARLGELSLPILLKKIYNFGYLKGSLYLILLRIFDFLSLFFIFTLSFLYFFYKRKLSLSFIYKHSFILGLVLIFLSIFLLFSRYFMKKYKNKFEDIENILFNLNRKTLIFLFTISLLIWSFKFFTFFLIFRALKYNFSYLETIFIVSFAEITTILPIHSLGGFGSFELGIIQGAYLLNISLKKGLEIGFSLHIFLLIFSFLVFLVSLYIYTKKSKI